MKTLYIYETGSILKKQYGKIIVCKQGIKIHEERIIDIESVVLFGNIQITTQVMHVFFENGINVFFLERSGKLKGAVYAESNNNVFLRLAQFDAWRDETRRLELARIFVQAKLENQILHMQHYRKLDYKQKHKDFELALKGLLESSKLATSINELMGYEGVSARKYFDFYGLCCRGMPFSGRNRRPPLDPVNALLSLTYSTVQS